MSEPEPASAPEEQTAPAGSAPPWISAILLVVLVLGAFAVPIVGPLRDSGARLVIAVLILILGGAFAYLLLRRPDASGEAE